MCLCVCYVFVVRCRSISVIQAVKKYKAGLAWADVRTRMVEGAGNLDDPRTRAAPTNNSGKGRSAYLGGSPSASAKL